MPLGLTDAIFGRASYSLPIHLDEVSCSGSEANLVDCPRAAIGVHDCRHREDASVDCLGRSPGMCSRERWRKEGREGGGERESECV